MARAAPDCSLDMRYQHMSNDGVLKTGECRSLPEVLADGRLRVHESWQWTLGTGGSGTSVIEEIREADEPKHPRRHDPSRKE